MKMKKGFLLLAIIVGVIGVGLGDYTGGELIVYDEDGKNPVKKDIRNKFYTFNGSKYPHETAPFKGERYTLVFYST